jgi:hypothetical protein
MVVRKISLIVIIVLCIVLVYNAYQIGLKVGHLGAQQEISKPAQFGSSQDPLSVMRHQDGLH